MSLKLTHASSERAYLGISFFKKKMLYLLFLTFAACKFSCFLKSQLVLRKRKLITKVKMLSADFHTKWKHLKRVETNMRSGPPSLPRAGANHCY